MPGILIQASPFYTYKDLLRFREYNERRRLEGSKKRILVLFGDNDKDKFRTDARRSGNAQQAAALSMRGDGADAIDFGEDSPVLGIITVAYGGRVTVDGKLDKTKYSAQLVQDVIKIREVLANDGVVVVPWGHGAEMCTLGSGSAGMDTKNIDLYLAMVTAISELSTSGASVQKK